MGVWKAGSSRALQPPAPHNPLYALYRSNWNASVTHLAATQHVLPFSLSSIMPLYSNMRQAGEENKASHVPYDDDHLPYIHMHYSNSLQLVHL